jgi:hypothetical protein
MNKFLSLLLLSTTGSALARRSIDPPTPEECPLAIYPMWNVTELIWYNGSKSLDCSRDSGLEFCQGALLPPDNCPPNEWINPCNVVGYSTVQPYGWTPPASLIMHVDSGEDCDTAPDTVYPYTIGVIGEGSVHCGYEQSRRGFELSFVADSSLVTQTVNISYSPQRDFYPCREAPGSSNPLDVINIKYYGETTFTLDCVRDEFNNATCTAASFEIPITSWTILD